MKKQIWFRKSTTLKWSAWMLLAIIFFTSCRKDAPVDPGVIVPDIKDSSAVNKGTITGLYVLNEGNMGSSKSSLDFYDFEKDTMYLNVFNKANPEIVKGLGDVGNDLGIYGSKLFIVVNNSNKIEVTDAHSVKSLKTIHLNQCRYIAFYKNNAYVTSNDGYVAVIDTAILAITDTIHVGRNPEELVVVGSKLYVANSGGYSPPNYDSTISVIDLNTQKEIKKIPVAINLHRLAADSKGNIYATSRGDYYTTPSALYLVNTTTDRVTKKFGIGASNLAMNGDSLYLYQHEFSMNTGDYETNFSLINTNTLTVGSGFITDGTGKAISTPYGLIVHPQNGNIFITDAKDYVTPGTLFCYSREGKLRWSVRTGDIPSGFAFLYKK
ncbi:MAG: DUF5074 domain-containing protein [Ginsengibacter sp.]